MAIRNLSDGNPDGWLAGQNSSDKGAFFGSTPVVQPTSASQAAVTITAVTAVNTTATVTTAAHGFATGTQADALVKRVAQMQVDVEALGVMTDRNRTDMVALGLVKGS